MKKILLIIVLILIGCDKKNPINIDLLRTSKNHSIYFSRETNEPYSGPVFYLDENDNIFLEGLLKDGKKNGGWIYWDRYGNKIEGIVSKKVPSNFTGTLFDFYYYEDDIFVSHVPYEKGIREGLYTSYLKEKDLNLKSREKHIRSIREEGTYKNGLKEGPYSWEFEFGEFKGHRVEGTFKNGVREGPSVYYFSDGDREESTYKNGVKEGPFVIYYSGEFKGDRREGTFKNGVKEGPCVYYYSDGDREESTYKNGVHEGPFVTYYSGEFKGHRVEGIFKNGVKEGPYVYYYSDGSGLATKKRTHKEVMLLV